MFQPPRFVDSKRPKHVCLLKKSVYRLKEAPWAWYQRFASYLHRIGFLSSMSDASLFIYHKGHSIAYLLLYVDDIILTASTDSLCTEIMTLLSREFAMTDLGKLSFFLGISARPTSSGGLFLTQE